MTWFQNISYKYPQKKFLKLILMHDKPFSPLPVNTCLVAVIHPYPVSMEMWPSWTPFLRGDENEELEKIWAQYGPQHLDSQEWAEAVPQGRETLSTLKLEARRGGAVDAVLTEALAPHGLSSAGWGHCGSAPPAAFGAAFFAAGRKETATDFSIFFFPSTYSL